ncbi:hypothetical protein [Pseudomonas putida]|uniref:hypothetical protein n=1 Tax=Pseudomonas putida TaxID=303 RepID=UPI000981B009|nr:hypothetical protein [Pseudomonas putida]OMQ29735.1 hypothetical protein BKX96_29960 [Pseudomonas putida]
MNDELMVSAICWEMDAAVSASFAHAAPKTDGLLFFCPDCLVDVAASISKKQNFFFKAPTLHKPGCDNEKRQSKSTLAGDPAKQPSANPETIIPSHLGELPKRRKQKKPSMSERQALAESIQPCVILHPGTLREVVDAWFTMTMSERKEYLLTVSGTQMTYYDAFAFLNSGGDISSLGCAETVVVGSASVNEHGDFYVTTRSKFKNGEQMLPIKARVLSSNPDFNLLKDGRKDVHIFLHGATPILNSWGKYFHPPAATLYTGFVIKPKKAD